MDNFDKQLEQILIHRKPEFWLNNMFSNLIEYVHGDYPNNIFYKKRNELLFEYDSGSKYFYYHYSKIYLTLKNNYHCNDYIINKLIKNNVKKHLKLNVKTTEIIYINQFIAVKEYLKLSVKTTYLLK